MREFLNNAKLAVLPLIRRTYLWAVAAAALAVLLIFWTAYLSRYGLSNLDGISYLSLAKQYADGHLDTAVNAHWSPLISWLMAPLIKLGMDAQLAFMTVNAFAASFVLGASAFLVWKSTKNLPIVLLLTATLTPFLMRSVDGLSPDMLVMAWVVLFLTALIYADRLADKHNLRHEMIAAGVLGAVGALGYFAKLYALPVFMAVVLLWTLLRIVVHRRQVKQFLSIKSAIYFLRVPVLAFIIFVLLIAPWVITLSVKYDKFMIGSALAHNMGHRFQAPPEADESQENEEESEPEAAAPTRRLPVLTPPNERAVTPSEDRAPPGTTSKKGATITRDGLTYYGRERLKALPYYVNRVSSLAPFIIVVMLALGAAVLFGKVTYRTSRMMVLTGLIFIVYFGGYWAVTGASSAGGNVRYYWPLLPLAVLIASLALPGLWQAVRRLQLWRKVLFVAVVLLLPFTMFTQYIMGLEYPYSIPFSSGPSASLQPSTRTIALDIHRLPEKSRLQIMAESLQDKGIIEPGDKIFGNNYRQTYRLAYFLEAQAYRTANRIDNSYTDALAQELRDRFGIDYFFNFVPTETGVPLSEVEANIVATFHDPDLPCTDERSGPRELCTIQVVRIER